MNIREEDRFFDNLISGLSKQEVASGCREIKKRD
jgi:hypothetical protein